jgi:inner membrane protein
MLQIPALIWVVLGLLFVLVEILTPSFVFVFFGTAAIATGLAVALGLPHTYGLPFVLFVALTVGQIYFFRAVFTRWFAGGEGRAAGAVGDDEFVGREVVVVSGFEAEGGRGKVTFRGAHWSAVSNHALSPGEIALIQGREGLTLVLEKLNQKTQ